MILLFTDFGADDLYVGQVKAAIARIAPDSAVVDLLHAAPDFNVPASAHLLAALAPQFPDGSIFLAVVDPGVGGPREAVVLEADGRWFVGPDNGLLSVLAQRAGAVRCWRIVWRPDALSASFHGRDLFAPMAAWIATGPFPSDKLEQMGGLGVRLAPADLAEIIYLDHYGNAFTGLRAENVDASASLQVADRVVAHARVFSEVPPGTAFWYENSLGLVEIAVNGGCAAEALGLGIGQAVALGKG